MKLNTFLRKLFNKNDFDNVYNQYHKTSENHKITRHNMTCYLEHMQSLKPSILIVGEAPGYKGCRLTGVPFTSEKLLLLKKYESSILHLDYHFRSAEKYSGEASATIVWETLDRFDFYPLIWNAFPYHPHKEGQEDSNRKPNKDELEFGKVLLKDIIKMYDIKRIYAIGNTAYESLIKLGFDVEKIRHPANGGKRDFVSGIECIVKDLS